MKKIITFLILFVITIANYGQPDYTIERIGTTFCAIPGIGTGLIAYSASMPSSAIQLALDATGVAGGGIVFCRTKGVVWDNCDALEMNYPNVTLEGDNKLTGGLKLKANFDAGKTWVSRPAFIAIEANGITIRNLQLDGNYANQTYQWAVGNITGRIQGILVGNQGTTRYDFLLKDCYIHDFTEYGLYAIALDRGEVMNCYFKDNQENNLLENVNSTNLVVHHSVFSGSASVSVAISGTNNEVSDCQIRDGNIAGGGSCWGGEFMSPIRCKFIDNVITGFKTGIGTGGLGNSNNIENNIITTVTNGLDVVSDLNTTIKNNTIRDFTTYGIKLQACIKMDVSGNTVSNLSGSGTAALYLTNVAAVYSITNVFKDNILLDIHGYGVQIAASCNGNTFLNNIIDGTGWGDVFNASTGSIWRGNYGKKTGGWLYETSK